MLTNSDRVKWIKLLWLEQGKHHQTESNALSFFLQLQKINPELLKFKNMRGDAYQRVKSIIQL